MWPDSTRAQEAQFATDHGGLRGAINVYFFRDVEIGTAHAWFGSGPVFCGEEAGTPMSAVDFMQILAHEIGHALCLTHLCPNSGEAASDTFFNRACQDGDEAFLMYPYWDVSDSMQFPPGQVDQSRAAATRLETGKTNTPDLGGFACPATPDTVG
jgi:hypothetical protein